MTIGDARLHPPSPHEPYARQRLKILYDASTFGSGIGSTLRGGIFRVVDRIVAEAIDDPDVDALITALSSEWASISTTLYCNQVGEPLKSRFRRGWRSLALPMSVHIRVREHLYAWEQAGRPRSLSAFFVRAAWFAAKHTIIRSPIAGSFDIFHSLFHALPPHPHLDCRARVITIYDLIPMLNPEYFTPDMVAYFKQILKSIDPLSDWVVCDSASTKRDLLRYVDIRPERVEVIHLAADPTFRRVDDEQRISDVRARYGIPDGRYLLSVSTLEPRKNLPFLLRCFARLLESDALAGVNLVLAGPKGWMSDPIYASLSDQRLKGRVHATGFVADEHLPALYTGALAFVYPSLYEGFGLPPLEAMSCGTPVITSNTSSLPEVVGDAGLMVDPTDESALCAAMRSVVDDCHLRSALSERALARAKRFTWRSCMQDHVTFYRRILDSTQKNA
ncbi:MAG: glycosyltransferase family 4 protein [Planctomycetes bacterium]|nr:glycosyltransferase family 4 protein [Planctomycetota bacterium]